MEIVIQKGAGCAIASVAMLAGLQFEEAVRMFRPRWQYYNDVLPVSNAQVLKVLTKLGLKHKQHFVKRWQRKAFKLPKYPSLFTCDYNEYRNTTHCAVWDPETKKFLDPGGWDDDPLSKYTKYVTDYIEVYNTRNI